MGVPVSNFNEFQDKLISVKKKSTIFGLLLYDSRPSQKTIARFAQENPEWIDELARNAGIYFFFPFKSDNKNFKNPSIELARMFKLGLSRLPGIVLFAPPDDTGKVAAKHFAYLPLEEQDFNDANIYEPILDELFGLIRDSIDQHKKADAVLHHIKNELSRLRRTKNRRGFARYLRKGAHLVLVELPKSLLDTMAESMGKALADKVVGA